MNEILLTHGFFLDEDEIEQRIMRPYPPLGILYVAAALQSAAIPVDVFDSTFQRRGRFVERLESSPPSILGIYTTHMTRHSVIRQVKAAKQRGWITVLGGPDSAGYPVEYLGCGADVIVIGEGEETLRELAVALQTVDVRHLHGIPGIVFQDADGHIIRNGSRPFLPVNNIPHPDRRAVDIQAYLDAWRKVHGHTSLNIVTSRGCPFACRWCSHAVFGNSRRQRDPGDCVREVREIYDAYHPDRIWYVDDVFTFDPEWLRRFAGHLHREKLRIPFETITRADRLLDPEIVDILVDAGCFRLWIGSESGSDRILAAMNRGVTAGRIRRAVELARSAGIETGIFVMWGYPGESPDDIRLTVEHVAAMQPDIWFTTVVHPIRNTPFYLDVADRLIHPADWAVSSDKDYILPDQRSRDTYRAATRWLNSAVEAAAVRSVNPGKAAELDEIARVAREQVYASETGDRS